MYRWLLGVISSIGLMASAAWGQCTGCATGAGDIRVVRIPAGGTGTPVDMFCTAAGADFAIDLASHSWSTDDWVIHVYDCTTGTTTPVHHIGKITITGDPSGITSLAILIADENQSWTESNDTPLDAGCIDFGGIEITDPDVLAKTRASVSMSGALTQVDTAAPGLHANQFVRVQVEGRDGGSGTWIGGVIEGDIVAEASGTLFGTTDSIGHVRAWNRLGAACLSPRA